MGRVQSPTLKLIVDREREIDEFVPEDYWEIFAEVGGIGESSKGFQVKYFFTEEGKESDRVLSAEESDRILGIIKGADEVKVEEVKNGNVVMQTVGGLLIAVGILDFALSWGGTNITGFLGPLSQFTPMIFGFSGSAMLSAGKDQEE